MKLWGLGARVLVLVPVLLVLRVSQSEAALSLGVSALGLAGAALYAGFESLRCSFYECCAPRAKWIQPNMTGKPHHDGNTIIVQFIKVGESISIQFIMM